MHACVLDFDGQFKYIVSQSVMHFIYGVICVWVEIEIGCVWLIECWGKGRIWLFILVIGRYIRR